MLVCEREREREREKEGERDSGCTEYNGDGRGVRGEQCRGRERHTGRQNMSTNAFVHTLYDSTRTALVIKNRIKIFNVLNLNSSCATNI